LKHYAPWDHLYLPQVMPTMSFLPTGLLAAPLPQALGYTNKTIGGGRQTTLVAIFGLLPFKGFDALLLIFKSGDRLFESFTQALIRFAGLGWKCKRAAPTST